MKTTEVNIKETKPWFKGNSKWPFWLKKIERWIRIRILKQPRYLLANFTIEKAQDLQTIHGLDLEDELAKILGEEINQELKNGSYTWKELCERDKD